MFIMIVMIFDPLIDENALMLMFEASKVASQLKHVWTDCLASFTIYLCRKDFHLLEKEDGAGDGHHLSGQGALAGAKEATHDAPQSL